MLIFQPVLAPGCIRPGVGNVNLARQVACHQGLTELKHSQHSAF